jgi:hypothetical protein
MKTFSLSVIFLTVAPTLAHPNMRSLYRVKSDASDVSSAFHTDKGLKKAIRRELGLPMEKNVHAH